MKEGNNMAKMNVPQLDNTESKVKKRKLNEMIENDIHKIEDVIISDNADEMKKLHQDLDGKYHACIAGWGHSMYSYSSEYGFAYDFLSRDSMLHNLKQMKASIKAYKLGLCSARKDNVRATEVNVSVQNNNNNSINIDTSFDLSRNQILENNALSQKETDDILEKINELEKIMKGDMTRKVKWERIKPIIQFSLNKGIDVAIAILTPIIQTNLM